MNTGMLIIPLDSMESSPPIAQIPTKKALENYAVSYIGAYLNTIQKEMPDHQPVLARNQPCGIEICLLPNKCFVMIFEKSDKQTVTVTERSWSDIEGKIMSGALHLVTVYAHEGVTVADAISRGKRDALRDTRSVEDSSLVKSLSQLENILQGMVGIEQGNKEAMKFTGAEAAKLVPVLESIKKVGPEVDMLGMLDALRNYPVHPVSINIDSEEKDVLENVVTELGTLSDVLGRVENQDHRLEELEQAMKKTLSELNRSIDERIGKGLAVILSSSDKKIDKGLAAVLSAKRGETGELPKDLEIRMDRFEKAAEIAEMLATSPRSFPQADAATAREVTEKLERLEKATKLLEVKTEEMAKVPAVAVSTLPPDIDKRIARLEQLLDRVENEILNKPDVAAEVVGAVAELRESIFRVNSRLINIEDYLVHMKRQRTLKSK